jgi:hypothetical protein
MALGSVPKGAPRTRVAGDQKKAGGGELVYKAMAIGYLGRTLSYHE